MTAPLDVLVVGAGYTAGGTDLTGLRAYLDRWLPRP